MKVSELSGAALDWAVARCEGYKDLRWNHKDCVERHLMMTPPRAAYGPVFLWELGYSTDWSIAGPIIERENVTLSYDEDSQTYSAYVSLFRQRGMSNRTRWRSGPTPLVAAMRCYVASKLGDEIEIPEELLK